MTSIPGVGELGDRPGEAEVDVVGMRGHHEYPLDPGQIQRRQVTHGRATLSPVPESPFDARELVGLLADDDRRR